MHSQLARLGQSARCRRWIVGAAGAVLLYLLAGFFLVPPLVKWQLREQLSSLTRRPVAVRQVRCNPLTLSLTVRDLAVAETNGQPFASLAQFHGNFQLSTLFRFAWTFREISLAEPRVSLVLRQDKRFNFADLLGSATNAPAPRSPEKTKALPRVLIFDLSVTNGHLSFADLSRKTPFRTTYKPIHFHLRRFTTRASRESPFSFEALTDSGRGVAWEGSVTVQPLASAGTLRVSGMELPRHSPYVEDLIRAKLKGGSIDISGSYQFTAGSNELQLAASQLDVTLSQLKLEDPATDEAVLALPSLELRGGSFGWPQRQIRFDTIRVQEPAALVRRLADGSINIPSLFLRRMAPQEPPTAPDTPPGGQPPDVPWQFAVEDYQLQNGSVQFEDATVPGPFRSVLKPVTVRVQHFSTAPGTEARALVELTTEAEEAVKLTADYSVSRAGGRAVLELKSVDLKRYQPYLHAWFRGIVSDGKADLALEVASAMEGAHLRAAFTNATLRLSSLRIHSATNGEPVLVVPELSVENVSGSLPDRTIHIAGVRSEGLSTSLRRAPDGSINLLALIPPRPEAEKTAAPATEESRPWQVRLDEVDWRDWAVHLNDGQLPRPGSMELDQLALRLRALEFPSNAPVAFEFSTRVNQGGTVSARGSVRPYTPALTADLEVAGLELSGLQPWLEPHLRMGIVSGTADAQLQVQVAEPAGQPRVRLSGALGVRQFASADPVLSKEFVRWELLGLSGITAELLPHRAAVKEVVLAGLRGSVIIGPDKRANFLTILPPGSTNPPAGEAVASAESPPKSGSSFPIQVGSIRLANASFHFTDQSVQPPCLFEVAQLEGAVTGLSSEPDSPAEVDISGRVEESSPFALRGRINPLAPAPVFDLVFTNHNLELTPFSPYMERYAGHPLHKGRLSLDLRYAVQGQELNARNTVRIDQLMLGARNDSADATRLPVKLAVALLKDNNGLIELDLPLGGRLDDPKFRVAPVLLQVLGNVIIKAAASPFKLVGALVGGGEELRYIDFEPGRAQLLEAERSKLDKLVQALGKRPALSLEIEGSVDPRADRDALARDLVRQELKSRRLQELSAIGQAQEGAAAELEPDHRDRLLRALLVETCGTNLTQALQDAVARLAADTNAAPATRPHGPGLLARAASLFKPSGERAATRLAHKNAQADSLLREQNPELGRLSAAAMEALIAGRTEVPPDLLQELRQGRAKAVQSYLLDSGRVAAERLFLVAPRPGDDQGQPRVQLSLN